jgi:hypothetical protein
VSASLYTLCFEDMSKRLALFIASCVVLVASAEERDSCSPIPGAERLWARSELRFVLVGEMHGTNETPAVFGDLVCSASETKRTIIAGLEVRDQQALNRFMDSKNRETSVKELLSTDEWKGTDGRASSAMLVLVERLRSLKADGLLSRVIAFSASGGSAAQDEEAMSSALLRASTANPGALVIVLTGNVHASKQELAEVGSYRLMGSFLPPAQTVSLLVTDRGGEAWNCQDGSCGPHTLASSAGVNREITLISPHVGYDGVLSTGLSVTASKPANR